MVAHITKYLIRVDDGGFKVYSDADERLVASFTDGQLADTLEPHHLTADQIAAGLRCLCATGFTVEAGHDFNDASSGATVARHLVNAMLQALNILQ